MNPVAPPSALKDTVREEVQSWSDRLVDLSGAIHANPETAFEERAAASRVGSLLESAGFKVVRGIGDMDTAVVADFGTGKFQVVVCAEYDALPNIGHGCGHNIIAAAGVGAAIALSRVAGELDISVRLIGTPAEEKGGGKVLLLRQGVFDQAAVAMMIHPDLTDIDPRGMSSMAASKFRVVYRGRGSHAGGNATDGVNAGSAAVVAQVAVGLIRQQLDPVDNVSVVSTNAGQDSSTIPELAELSVAVRSPTIEGLTTLRQRVVECFEGGGHAIGCGLEITPEQPDYYPLLQDPVLADLFALNMSSIGRTVIPLKSGRIGASTDMGNVSQLVPSIHPQVAITGATAVGHSSDYTVAAATPAAEDTIRAGAACMAMTVVDIVDAPDHRAHFLELLENRVKPSEWSPGSSKQS